MRADSILSSSDLIYAIDTDIGSLPGSPGTEGAANVLDSNSGTKYLIWGNNWSGFIVTPGTSLVQSMQFTTANDAQDRDPAYYFLYGTDDPITSGDFSQGRSENWSVISSGPLSLPSTRYALSPVTSFANSTAYSSYKLLFPRIKNGGTDMMQIADVNFYASTDGTGANVLAPGQPIVPVDDTGRDGSSRYPAAESSDKALDGNVNTKYLNFGEANSGFIVVPSIGPSIVQSFDIWTANDSPERDPASYALYGHNGPVGFGDNSLGDFEDWALIGSGTLSLPTDRLAYGGITPVANSAAYDAYRFVVTSVKNGTAANSMQFADIQFYGVIPEPTTVGLLALGLGGLWMAVRRKSA